MTLLPFGLGVARRGPPGGGGRGAAALLFGIALGACNFGTDEPYLAGEPLVPLQPVSTAPLQDAVEVPIDVAPSVRWNDRVHPGSLEPGAVTLRAGETALVATPRVDLLDCIVAVRPLTPLAPATPHTASFEGLRGFGTAAQRAPMVLAFTTGDATAAAAPRPAPSFGELYAELLGPHCASCHVGHLPPAGLDLSSPERAEQALRSGRATRYGEVPYVVPGDHGSSYLLWKLLGLPGIAGQAMPPSGSFPIDRACRTPDPGLRRIADWVDGLAP